MTPRLSEQETAQLIERTLVSARPPMQKWLGLTTRGFDAADEIAHGIAFGIRAGLTELDRKERDAAGTT